MKTPIEVPPGAAAEFVLPVTAEVTVKHFHPEMPAVLGTPFLVYAMEVAASEAMRPFLPPGWVSVGAEVNVRHLAATPLGGSVTARATAVSVSGTLVSFTVEARDGRGLVGEGTHVRGAVELGRFLRRLAERDGGVAQPG